jgi:hypothetical protein
LTADAFRYEYLRNPDVGGKLYYAMGDDGAVVATQAFVGQTLIRNGSPIRTLMSERTLLSAPLRGKVDYARFYADALRDSVDASGARFIWGGTAAVKAFQKFGFEAVDCFFTDTLVVSPAPVLRAFLRGASWRSRAFYTAAYGFSLGKHLPNRLARRRVNLMIARATPTAEELAQLVHRVSAANPDSYFLYYTPEKLRWLVDENAYRDRQTLLFRVRGELVGLAIIEIHADDFVSVVDLLVSEVDRVASYVRALTEAIAQLQFGGLRFFGNAANAYVACLRHEFRRLGSVALPNTVQLVIRGSSDDGMDHPPASALAMTGVWAPPA